MITNPILCNNPVAIVAALCGLIILAAIMLPRVIHHRKKAKQRHEENLGEDKNENS